jgi:hypothetical protein
MLHKVGWYMIADVSGQYIDPISKSPVHLCLRYMILDGNDMSSRNVGSQLPTFQNGERLDYATDEVWNLAKNIANFQCEMLAVQFVQSTAVVR